MADRQNVSVKSIIYTVIAGVIGCAVLFVMLFSYEGSIIRSSLGNMAFICIFAGIVVYAAVPVIFKSLRNKPERLFLYLFLVPAVISLIFITYGFVPDEQTHFLRAISLSQFHVFSGVADAPVNLESIYCQKGLEGFAGLWQIQAAGETVQVSCTAAIFYPPVSYLPQALGAFIAGLFTDNIYIVLIVSRAFTLAATAIIIYHAVKIAPFGKYIIIAISILPLFIQEAASVSVDGLTNAVVLGDIAFFFYLKQKNSLLTRRQIIMMGLLVICTFSVKVIYGIMAFVFLMIGKEYFGSRKRKTVTMLIIYGIAVLLPIIYILITYLTGFEFSQSTGNGASIMTQLGFMLSHPFSYAGTLVRTIAANFSFYVKSCYTLLLLSFPVSGKAMAVLAGGLVFIIVVDYHEKVKKTTAAFLLAAAVVTVMVIFTMEYLQWTEPEAEIIAGVQGRYFFPLILPVALAFGRTRALSATDSSYICGTSVSADQSVSAAKSGKCLSGRKGTGLFRAIPGMSHIIVLAAIAAMGAFELITAAVTILC